MRKKSLLYFLIFVINVFNLNAFSMTEFKEISRDLNKSLKGLLENGKMLEINMEEKVFENNKTTIVQSKVFIGNDCFAQNIYNQNLNINIIKKDNSIWKVENGKKQLLNDSELIKNYFQNWWDIIIKSDNISFSNVAGKIIVVANIKPYNEIEFVVDKNFLLCQADFFLDKIQYTINLSNYIPLNANINYKLPKETRFFANGVEIKKSIIKSISIVDYSEEIFNIERFDDYGFKNSVVDFFNFFI